MEFLTNEKVILLDKSRIEDFFVKIERILDFGDNNAIYEYSYNDGMDFGFTYKEFLKKPTVIDKCSLFSNN
jgi:hypothetical protein